MLSSLNRERVYLAARYDRQQEMKALAETLEATGQFEVTARWIQGNHEMPQYVGQRPVADPTSEEERITKIIAEEDLIDLLLADTVISFTEKRDVGYNRGGRHVEFGIALAARKRLIIVGPRENVFHWLDEVEHVRDIPELFELYGLIRSKVGEVSVNGVR